MIGKGLEVKTFKGLIGASYKDKPPKNINGYELVESMSNKNGKVYYNPQKNHPNLLRIGVII